MNNSIIKPSKRKPRKKYSHLLLEKSKRKSKIAKTSKVVLPSKKTNPRQQSLITNPKRQKTKQISKFTASRDMF